MKYLDSPRHKLEVQHYRYRTAIKKLLKKFGPVTQMSYPGAVKSDAKSSKRSLQAAE